MNFKKSILFIINLFTDNNIYSSNEEEKLMIQEKTKFLLENHFNSIKDLIFNSEDKTKVFKEQFNVNIRDKILANLKKEHPIDKCLIRKTSNSFYSNKLTTLKHEEKNIITEVNEVLTDYFNSIKDSIKNEDNKKILEKKFNVNIRYKILEEKKIYKKHPKNKRIIKEASNNFYENKLNSFINNTYEDLESEGSLSVIEEKSYVSESYMGEKEDFIKEFNGPIPTDILMDKEDFDNIFQEG